MVIVGLVLVEFEEGKPKAIAKTKPLPSQNAWKISKQTVLAYYVTWQRRYRGRGVNTIETCVHSLQASGDGIDDAELKQMRDRVRIIGQK